MATAVALPRARRQILQEVEFGLAGIGVLDYPIRRAIKCITFVQHGVDHRLTLPGGKGLREVLGVGRDFLVLLGTKDIGHAAFGRLYPGDPAKNPSNISGME